MIYDWLHRKIIIDLVICQVLYDTEGENRRPEEIGHDMSAQVGKES